MKYVWSTLISDRRCSIEIWQRIAMEKRAFIQKIQLLTNRKLNIKMRKNSVKCYVCTIECIVKWVQNIDDYWAGQEEVRSNENVDLKKNNAN